MGVAIIVPGVSFADANLGVVTINNPDALYGIRILGPSAVNGGADAGTYTVEYSPADTIHTGVVWSVVSGGAYASIDAATGVLSVLEGASDDQVTIRATSSYDGTVYAEKNVAVTYRVPLENLTHYFEFGGQGYFVTDIEPLPTDTFKAVFLLATTASNRVLFGSRKQSNLDDDSCILEFGQNGASARVLKTKSGGKFYASPNAVAANQKYVVTFNKDGAACSPSLGSFSESDYTYGQAWPLAIGSMRYSNGGVANEKFMGNLWGVEIMASNGTLKHRLIPQANGKLLDEVTGISYEATGTVTYV